MDSRNNEFSESSSLFAVLAVAALAQTLLSVVLAVFNFTPIVPGSGAHSVQPVMLTYIALAIAAVAPASAIVYTVSVRRKTSEQCASFFRAVCWSSCASLIPACAALVPASIADDLSLLPQCIGVVLCMLAAWGFSSDRSVLCYALLLLSAAFLLSSASFAVSFFIGKAVTSGSPADGLYTAHSVITSVSDFIGWAAPPAAYYYVNRRLRADDEKRAAAARSFSRTLPE